MSVHLTVLNIKTKFKKRSTTGRVNLSGIMYYYKCTIVKHGIIGVKIDRWSELTYRNSDVLW